MCNVLLSDLEVMDMLLLDAGDDEVVVIASVLALRIGVSNDLVISLIFGDFFLLLARVAIGLLVGSTVGCWRIAAVDCPRSLQTRMPSDHACTTCVLPAPPQFPNQEPPRPQQLSLPDLRMVPHLAQTEPMAFVVAAACAHVQHSQTHKEGETPSVEVVT